MLDFFKVMIIIFYYMMLKLNLNSNGDNIIYKLSIPSEIMINVFIIKLAPRTLVLEATPYLKLSYRCYDESPIIKEYVNIIPGATCIQRWI